MAGSSFNVALVSSPTTWGGGEQLLWTLGTGLEQRGHRVLWIARESSALVERLEANQSDYLTIAGRHPSIGELVEGWSILRMRGVRSILGNDSHAMTWSAGYGLGRSGVKRIGMKHTVFPVSSGTKFNWLLDKLICVSNAARSVCEKAGIDTNRLQTIYGGIELPQSDIADSKRAIYQELNLASNTTLITAVGSLIASKGFDLLIDAAKLLKSRTSRRFQIVICGDGPERRSLQSQIEKLGLENTVRLVGFQQQPERWIAASDLFVHPTRSEGLSLVAIMAQMLGTNIVATEVGGLNEVMHDPRTGAPLGWILDQHNPKRLCELMNQALTNPVQSNLFALAAKQSAMTRFSASQMIDNFLRVFQECEDQNISNPHYLEPRYRSNLPTAA